MLVKSASTLVPSVGPSQVLRSAARTAPWSLRPIPAQAPVDKYFRTESHGLHTSVRAASEKGKGGSQAEKLNAASSLTAQSIAEADEALRQRLLDRDGGSASVATVNGQWEPGMGRETARQMFRVLDQARVNRPGKDVAAGEGESKHWSRRGSY